jgi:hypothetical protein
MKIMVELDTAVPRETFLLAEFLTKLSLLENSDAAPSAERTVGKHPALAADFDRSKVPPAGVPIEGEPVKLNVPVTPLAPSNVVPLKPEIPPPPPPPGAAPAAPEYDTDGMPWDERIHASTKAKTIKGAWKNRRGVAEADRLAIEATLPRRMPDTPPPPPPPSTIPPPPPPGDALGVVKVGGRVLAPGESIADAVAAMKAATPPTPPPPATMPTVSGDDEADLEPDAETPAPTLPAAPEAPLIDFPTLMIKVSEAMAANTMTLDSVKAIIKPLGADTLFELSGKPELVVPVAKALGFA